MPADSLPDLMNYAEHWRTAMVIAATAAGLDSVFPDRSTGNKKTPYIEIFFTMGEATPHRRVVPNENPRAHMHDAFTGCVLTWTVKTNRETNAADHEPLCSQVRALMAQIFARPKSDLPYYQFNKAKPMREREGIDAQDTRVDVTQVPYDVDFSIRADAWPLPVDT